MKDSSMDKQSNLGDLENQTHSSLIVKNFTNELKGYSKEQLDLCLKKLNFLCLEFNPYETDHLKIEEENILNEFDLMSTLTNPFEFTNTVLQMLDNIETETKTRLQ